MRTLLVLVFIFTILFSIKPVFSKYPYYSQTMVQAFAGRSYQSKGYLQNENIGLVRRAAASYDIGLYFNLLYTPFYQIEFPVDIYLGYNFTKADDQVLINSPSEQLRHYYHCNYICGGLSIPTLPFIDVCGYGGIGLMSNDFRHDIKSQKYDYLNSNIQFYLMPGLELFYKFKRNPFFIKAGIYIKKDFKKAYDLPGPTFGGYSLIDHTSGQILTRLVIGFGKKPLDNKPQKKSVQSNDSNAPIKPKINANSDSTVPPNAENLQSHDTVTSIPDSSQAKSDTIQTDSNSLNEKHSIENVQFYLKNNNIKTGSLLMLFHDSIFIESTQPDGNVVYPILHKGAFEKIVGPDGREFDLSANDCNPVLDSGCWINSTDTTIYDTLPSVQMPKNNKDAKVDISANDSMLNNKQLKGLIDYSMLKNRLSYLNIEELIQANTVILNGRISTELQVKVNIFPDTNCIKKIVFQLIGRQCFHCPSKIYETIMHFNNVKDVESSNVFEKHYDYNSNFNQAINEDIRIIKKYEPNIAPVNHKYFIGMSNESISETKFGGLDCGKLYITVMFENDYIPNDSVKTIVPSVKQPNLQAPEICNEVLETTQSKYQGTIIEEYSSKILATVKDALEGKLPDSAQCNCHKLAFYKLKIDSIVDSRQSEYIRKMNRYRAIDDSVDIIKEENESYLNGMYFATGKVISYNNGTLKMFGNFFPMWGWSSGSGYNARYQETVTIINYKPISGETPLRQLIPGNEVTVKGYKLIQPSILTRHSNIFKYHKNEKYIDSLRGETIMLLLDMGLTSISTYNSFRNNFIGSYVKAFDIMHCKFFVSNETLTRLGIKNDISEEGWRSKANIMRVIMQNLSSIRYIYNKRLRDNPGLKGKINVKMAIDEYGNVISCKIVEDTMEDEIFTSEIVKRIRLFNFGKIDKPGYVEEVVYPYIFSE